MKLLNKVDFNELLSQIRLSSYDNDVVKHYDNLKLIGKITPKIATLEIILRNKLDSKLSEQDNDWIKNSNDENIKKAKIEIEKIDLFLSDLIKTFNEEILEYC